MVQLTLSEFRTLEGFCEKLLSFFIILNGVILRIKKTIENQ